MIRRGILGAGGGGGARRRAVAAADAGNMLVIEVEGAANGTVEIELLPDVAPKHVERIKALVEEGAYDGVAFHRVIDGFMAQTGDVEFGTRAAFAEGRAGTGGSKLPDLPAEFSDVPFERGTVGMARSQDPNSANTQFFIMFAPGAVPERPVHGGGPGDLGHGGGGCDPARRRGERLGRQPDFMTKVTLK